MSVRYLFTSRERRICSSRIIMALSEEIRRPDHKGRIIPGYPRTQIQITREPWQREAGSEAAPSP